MTQINVGSAANDNTGDPLRTAFLRINQYGILNDKTVNAAFYKTASNTNEAAITLAIVAAAPLGSGAAVWVPQSMLPYNASLVTFNINVRMIREGGNPQVWDIKAYGAAGDGVQDGTAAIQAAINGAQAGLSPGTVLAPNGNYLVSSTITIVDGITLVGSGMHDITQQTTFNVQSTTLDPVFMIQSDNGVTFRDFIIASPTAQTAGAYIRVRGLTLGVTQNQYSRFERIRLARAWIGFDFVDAATWMVFSCYIQDPRLVGLQTDNTLNPDAGDNHILSNWFGGATSVAGAVAILHKAGSIRVQNNKFWPFMGACYRFAWASASAGSSMLLITDNIFDNIAGASANRLIDFASSAGGAFVNVIIANNICKYNNNGGIFVATAAGPLISQMVITGNTFSTTTVAVAIQLNNLVNHVLIDSNHFHSTVAGPTAINVGPNITNNSVFIGGGNKFEGGANFWQAWVIQGSVIVEGPGRVGMFAPADGATITPDFASGNTALITYAGTPRTIGTPIDALVGSNITLEILNSSGGAVVTTFNGSWNLSGAWVDPANTKRRTITFRVVDGAGNMREINRTAADQ